LIRPERRRKLRGVPRLKRSTWILVVGLAVAGLVLAAGVGNRWRLQRKEQAAVAACQLHKANTGRTAPLLPDGSAPNPVLSKLSDYDLKILAKVRVPDLTKLSESELRALAAKYDLSVIDLMETQGHLKDAMSGIDGVEWDNESCDPQVLENTSNVRGIYADVLAADQAVSGSGSTSIYVALVIALLAVVPAAWYFLLRRIAELRKAIGGSPPAG
jgi:hypothetical protein